MNRHEDDVAIVQADVGGIGPVDQVLIEIQAVDQLLTAEHGQETEAAVAGGSTGGIQCGERSPRRGNLIGARPHHVSGHVHLNVTKPGNRDLKLGPGVRISTDSGVDLAQASVELVLELLQRQVGGVDLAYLWDDDEPFASDLQRVRLLDITRQNEHQLVAGPEPIILIDRPGHARLIPGGRSSESLQTEDLEPVPGHRLE